MFTERDNIYKVLKSFVKQTVSELNIGLSIWEVTDIKAIGTDKLVKQYKAQIKHLNFIYTLDNVPILGIGLGHMKGVMKYPNVGDFVIVGFIDSKPYILGTVFNEFAQPFDSVPTIKLDELMICQKENGSIFMMKENNDVMIRAGDSAGNIDNGARIRINADGSFKLFNKGNFGIECDSAGNITLRGVTINSTQTPGTF